MPLTSGLRKPAGDGRRFFPLASKQSWNSLTMHKH